jgi:hypothetical protein
MRYNCKNKDIIAHADKHSDNMQELRMNDPSPLVISHGFPGSHSTSSSFLRVT